MKKRPLIFACALLMAASAGAQSIYDAVNVTQKDLNGTARFVGMGGAMGALGGDISTIGTNPAGIGIFRSNDVMTSFGYSITGTESDYAGVKFENDKARWRFDNIGAVISTKIGNVTPLRYVNFGFNYHKTKSFYKNMTMSGLMGSVQMADGNWTPVSQVRYMAQQATDMGFYGNELASDEIYHNIDAGWLGIMGYQGWLTDAGGNGNIFYPYVPSEADAYFHSQERGGIDQYDLNVAFNINDRFYLGFTVGLYDVDYSKYTFYDERYSSQGTDGTAYQEGYSLETFKSIHGSGFDVKLGAIIRPFEYSPLRIGLAVHTPIFYSLTYTTGALLTPDIYLTDDNTGEEFLPDVVDTYSILGGRDMDRDFNLQTPWLVNASLGYTVGNALALGAEYEYENYSAMKFKYPDGGGEMSTETNEAKNNLKAVHTLRLGAEYRPISAFAMRAGYNYSTAVYEEGALKYLPTNALDTDTDFTNSQSMNTVTLGIGYRWSSFYMDLAYKFLTYKADFYPFFNEMSENAANDYIITGNESAFVVTPEATTVKNTQSQVLLTLGFRF